MHDANYLRECMSYCPATGQMTWKVRPDCHFVSGQKTAAHQASIWNAKYAGKPAFTSVGSHGYATSILSGKRLSAHRVAWTIHYGHPPRGEIDHINGDKLDNRIVNLRDVSRAENSKNLFVKSGDSRGVYWYSPASRWVAKIHSEGRMHHLGYFLDRSEAVAARRAAEVHFGFHENHGRAY